MMDDFLLEIPDPFGAGGSHTPCNDNTLFVTPTGNGLCKFEICL